MREVLQIVRERVAHAQSALDRSLARRSRHCLTHAAVVLRHERGTVATLRPPHPIESGKNAKKDSKSDQPLRNLAS